MAIILKGVCNMKQSLIVIYGSLAILIIIAYFVGGSAIILEGLNISIVTMYKSFLMLVASFIIIGQLNVLLSKDAIEKWLQKFSGIKAIIVSAIAGGLFPGGPYIYYPFVLSFREKKLPFYILITFIFGKQVYDLSRLPMEASLVSPEIALIRHLITFPIPIIVGLLVLRLYGSTVSINPTLKAGENDDSDNYNS